MDRRAACIAQASACRAKAEDDSANRDHWIDESIKWLERSNGGLAITFETRDGRLIPNNNRLSIENIAGENIAECGDHGVDDSSCPDPTIWPCPPAGIEASTGHSRW